MLATNFLPLLAVTALQFTLKARAQNSYITPCTKGFGDELNGCGGCNKTKAIEVPSWTEANYIENFHMPRAGMKDGGGYKVWWNIEQPADTCRVLIFDPSKNNAGKNPQTPEEKIPKVPGNIILTTAQSGCFLGQVSRKFFVGACCGDECELIGAVPSISNQRKRSVAVPVVSASNNRPPSRIIRAVGPGTVLGRTCTKVRTLGGIFTRSGRQQIAGQPQDCSAPGCVYARTVTTSVSSTIMNEKTIENHEGGSLTVGVEAGMSFLAGPSISMSVETSKEWSKTVTETMARTDTKSLQRSETFSFKLTPGGTYAGYFTPDLTCEKFLVNCQEHRLSEKPGMFDMEVELCDPIHDENNVPQGVYGMTTIG